MAKPKTQAMHRPELEDEDSYPQTPAHLTPAVQLAWNRNEISSDCAFLLMRVVALSDNPEGCCRMGNKRLAWISQMVSIRTVKYNIGWLVRAGWLHSVLGGNDYGTERRLTPNYERINAAVRSFRPTPPKQRARSCTTPAENSVQEVARPLTESCTTPAENSVQEVARPLTESCTTPVQEVARPLTESCTTPVQDLAHKEEKNKKARKTGQSKTNKDKAERSRLGIATCLVGDLDSVLSKTQTVDAKRPYRSEKSIADAMSSVNASEDTASGQFCAEHDWINNTEEALCDLDWITDIRKEKKQQHRTEVTKRPYRSEKSIADAMSSVNTNTPPPSAQKTKRIDFGTPSPDPKEKPKEETAALPSNSAVDEDDDDGSDFWDLPPEEQARWQAQGQARLAALRLARGLPSQRQDEAAMQAADEDEFSNESIDRDMALAEAAVAADAAANPQPEPDAKPTNKTKTPLRVVDPEADWDIYSEASPAVAAAVAVETMRPHRSK